jgi:hypothetical protein
MLQVLLREEWDKVKTEMKIPNKPWKRINLTMRQTLITRIVACYDQEICKHPLYNLGLNSEATKERFCEWRIYHWHINCGTSRTGAER